MKHIHSKYPSNSPSRSPLGFLIKITFSVFFAEAFVTLLFLVLPDPPDLIRTFVDPALLSVLISPALYLLVYKPLVQEISMRSFIEVELRQSQALLKQQSQELEETLKRLQQAPQLLHTEKMSSLGRLVAGIAHEINNPVNFVYGNLIHVQEYAQNLLELVHLYQKNYPDTEPEIQAKEEALDVEFLQKDLVKILGSMKSGCDRIRQIVLSLRNFSRMDEAEFKLVDIHDGIDSTLVILRHRLNSKLGHPALELIKDYGKLSQVECFPGQLNQVFMNLLANAIEALEETIDPENWNLETPSHTPVFNQLPTPTITIHTSMVDSDWVKIAIADNGSGMPERVREKIFEPFFTTKPVGKGTGMGLSISYQLIVEKHGGKLNCFSTLGKGTEFVIQIPVKQEDRMLNRSTTES